MNKSSAVKLAAMMLALMSVFVALQAYWIAQLGLPYMLRSLLAVSGGMILGYAVSILLIVRNKARISFERSHPESTVELL